MHRVALHASQGPGTFQVPHPQPEEWSQAVEANEKNFPSPQWVGPGPGSPSLSTAQPHLCQTGVTQFAAGCEIQLLQGLQLEQRGAPWLGGLLVSQGLRLQLSVWLWEEFPASHSSNDP